MAVPGPGAATSLADDLFAKLEALKQQFRDLSASGIEAAVNVAADSFIKLGDALQEVVPPLDDIKDFASENSVAKITATSASLNLLGLAFEKAFNKELGKNAKDMAESIKILGGVTDKEKQVVSAFGDILTGNLGNAYKTLSTLLVGASNEAQKFQVEMTKLGQDQNVIKITAEQAKKLAELGISYTDLKEATKATVTSIDASIRVTKEGTAEFEKNRLATQELIAFNKKFGIETSESAKLVNLFNTSFGQGTQGAQLFSDSLEKFALKTGQDVNTVFKAFTSNMDYFATMSSPRALQAFASLEAFAKRSGQEVSKVVANLEQFDDIATGYEKIGKLNRLLMQFGSSIDPQTFMDASPEEKQKMIIEATAQAQASFGAFTSETSRRQIAKAFSDATGQSVQLMGGLLSGNETARRDAIAALSQRPDMTGFTPEAKKELGKELSTSEDIGKLRDALLETTDSVQFLSRGMRETSMANIKSTRELYEKLDKTVFQSVATRDPGGFLKATAEIYREVGKTVAQEIKKGSIDGAKDFVGVIENAFDRMTNPSGVVSKNLGQKVESYVQGLTTKP